MKSAGARQMERPTHCSVASGSPVGSCFGSGACRIEGSDAIACLMPHLLLSDAQLNPVNNFSITVPVISGAPLPGTA